MVFNSVKKRGFVLIVLFFLAIFLKSVYAADLSDKSNLQYYNSEPGDKVTYVPIEEAAIEDESPTPECSSTLCRAISFDLPLKVIQILHSAHIVSDAKIADEHQKVLTELSMEHFALLDDVSNDKVQAEDFKTKNEELIQSKQNEIQTLQEIKKDNPGAVDSSALQIEASVANAVKDVETQAGIELPASTEARTTSEGAPTGGEAGQPTTSEAAESTPYANSEAQAPQAGTEANPVESTENPTEGPKVTSENQPDLTTSVIPENLAEVETISETSQTTGSENTQSSTETAGASSESTQSGSSEQSASSTTENPTEGTTTNSEAAQDTTSQNAETTSDASSDSTTAGTSDSGSAGGSDSAGGDSSGGVTVAAIYNINKIKNHRINNDMESLDSLSKNVFSLSGTEGNLVSSSLHNSGGGYSAGSKSATGVAILDFLKIKSKDSKVNKLARLERKYRNNLKVDMKLAQISNKTIKAKQVEEFDNGSIPISFRLDDITFEFTQIGILKNALNLTRKYNITMDLAVISLPFEVNGNPKAFKIFEENQDVIEIVAHGLTHYNPVDLSHEGEFYDITTKKNIPPGIQEDHIRKMRSIFKRHGIDDADDVFALPYSAGDENTITLSESNNYKLITQWVVPNDRFVYSDGNITVSRMIIGVPLQIKFNDKYYKDYQHELTNLLKLKQPIEIVLHPINLDQVESMEKIIQITKNVSGIRFHKIKAVSTQQTVCSAPYIRNGTNCCLDKNNNGICDIDEIEKIKNESQMKMQLQMNESGQHAKINETQKPKPRIIEKAADKCSLTNEIKCVDYKNNSNILQVSILNSMDSDISSVVAEVKDCGVSNKLDLREGESKNFTIVCSTGSRFNFDRQLSISYTVVNTGLSYYKEGKLKAVRK